MLALESRLRVFDWGVIAMLSRLLLAGLLLTAVSLTGCSPTGKLVGKWETDMNQAKAQMDKSGNSLTGALLSGFLSAMKVEAEFRADGTCTIGGRILDYSASNSATWRYVKSEGNVLVLMIKGDKNADEKELRLSFIDNDHFEMVSRGGKGGSQNLPFVRVKAN